MFFLRIQEQFQKNPDSYNGAIRENYTWSQDYTDLEVRVPVPKHVVKGKQVRGWGRGSTTASMHSREEAGLTERELGLLLGYETLSLTRRWLLLLSLLVSFFYLVFQFSWGEGALFLV